MVIKWYSILFLLFFFFVFFSLCVCVCALSRFGEEIIYSVLVVRDIGGQYVRELNKTITFKWSKAMVSVLYLRSTFSGQDKTWRSTGRDDITCANVPFLFIIRFFCLFIQCLCLALVSNDIRLWYLCKNVMEKRWKITILGIYLYGTVCVTKG